MESPADPATRRAAANDSTAEASTSSAAANPSRPGLSQRVPTSGATGQRYESDSSECPRVAEAGRREENGEDEEPASRFVCHVCLASPSKPVATVCGHIYCWSCLYKWLSLHRDAPNCPVCKAGIEMPHGDVSKARVVPLYVSEHGKDPRDELPEDIPQRPPGERPEMQRPPVFAFPPGGFGLAQQWGSVNVNATAGVGLFPSSIFGLAFVTSPALQSPGVGAGGAQASAVGAASGATQDTQQQQQQQQDGVWALEQQEAAQQEFLSRILFLIGTFIALALIFFP